MTRLNILEKATPCACPAVFSKGVEIQKSPPHTAGLGVEDLAHINYPASRPRECSRLQNKRQEAAGAPSSPARGCSKPGVNGLRSCSCQRSSSIKAPLAQHDACHRPLCGSAGSALSDVSQGAGNKHRRSTWARAAKIRKPRHTFQCTSWLPPRPASCTNHEWLSRAGQATCSCRIPVLLVST